MPKRTKTKYATRAEVAAYCSEHPEEIEMLAEMLGDERAEHVYRKLHPQPVLTDAERRAAMQGSELDSYSYCAYRLRGLECRNAGPDGICRCNEPRRPRLDELRDVLGMLDDALADLGKVDYLVLPESGRHLIRSAHETVRDARALLQSELGTNVKATPFARPEVCNPPCTTCATCGNDFPADATRCPYCFPKPAPPYRPRRLRTK